MADVINKAKKRASANNKGKYQTQYFRTHKNKVRAIRAHVERLKGALSYYEMPSPEMEMPANYAKHIANIKQAIADADRARENLPTKR